MRYLALSLTVGSAVSLGSLGVARADSVPVEGTRELRLGSAIGIMPTFGPGFASLSPKTGSDLTIASISAGLGYFVAEHVEVGGSLGYFYMSTGGSAKGPGLSAFFRVYSKTGNVGIFLEPTVEYLHLGMTGGSEDIVGPGADVGIEVFLADSWALRLSPTFRYYKE